jgi:hypothetical protein
MATVTVTSSDSKFKDITFESDKFPIPRVGESFLMEKDVQHPTGTYQIQVDRKVTHVIYDLVTLSVTVDVE